MYINSIRPNLLVVPCINSTFDVVNIIVNLFVAIQTITNLFHIVAIYNYRHQSDTQIYALNPYFDIETFLNNEEFSTCALFAKLKHYLGTEIHHNMEI